MYKVNNDRMLEICEPEIRRLITESIGLFGTDLTDARQLVLGIFVEKVYALGINRGLDFAKNMDLYIEREELSKGQTEK